jgi:uncharacterized membrane protein required for colicin V production
MLYQLKATENCIAVRALVKYICCVYILLCTEFRSLRGGFNPRICAAAGAITAAVLGVFQYDYVLPAFSVHCSISLAATIKCVQIVIVLIHSLTNTLQITSGG